MGQETTEAIKAIIKEYGKPNEEADSEIQVHKHDPGFLTYEWAGNWVKVMQPEPKNAEFTPLHRERIAMGLIHELNRRTIDEYVKVPMPLAYHIDGLGGDLGKPFSVSKALNGKLMASYFDEQGKFPAELSEKIGKHLGVLLSRIQAVTIEGAGLINPKEVGVHPGPWGKYFSMMLDYLFKQLTGQSVIEDRLVKKLGDMMSENKKILIGEVVTLGHNNFHFGSILVDEENKRISAVLNLSSAGAASAMVDIATMHVLCADETLWQSFLNGYESNRSFPSQFKGKLAYYSLIFALQSAMVAHKRGNEQDKGYYLRRAFESAQTIDSSFASETGKYAQFKHPSAKG